MRSNASSSRERHLALMPAERPADDAHAHSHSLHETEGFATGDVARVLRILTIAYTLAIVVGAAVLWPSRTGQLGTRSGCPPTRSPPM